MTKKIKDFDIEGSFGPDEKFKARSRFEVVIEDLIRDAGSVPVLDMNTLWYTSWDDDREVYNFKLVMYGVYVGKRKARDEVCGYSHETGQLVKF